MLNVLAVGNDVCLLLHHRPQRIRQQPETEKPGEPGFLKPSGPYLAVFSLITSPETVVV
ncbi:hypothetical protein SAMN05444064_114110 [Pseudomonas syringae]|nr:hypothetical protein SAMN05444514_113110 [Pseudomonas syringae]SFM34068.1 hypothetical protein SAMN05444064_114110 [Pseudomonas syringae]